MSMKDTPQAAWARSAGVAFEQRLRVPKLKPLPPVWEEAGSPNDSVPLDLWEFERQTQKSPRRFQRGLSYCGPGATPATA